MHDMIAKTPINVAHRVAGFLLAACVLMLTGCGDPAPRLKVGSKDFTESIVLGEILAQLAEAHAIPVERRLDYGDTADNLAALKRGDIDIYPEYNGTGLVLLGQTPTSDGDRSYARVQELYEPLGFLWGPRFGFANDYELVMRADHATTAGIETISDLAAANGEVSFGIDTEFQRRPVDGYSALLRRYGINSNADVVAEDTPDGKRDLYQALLSGKVDVVEGFSTDGQIARFGLRVLEDDLDFFPTYQAAPLYRQDAANTFPQIRSMLDQIEGLIDTEAMRDMITAVEVDGQDVSTVVSRFLSEHDLVDANIAADDGPRPLQIAIGELDALSGQSAIALSAARKAFSGRALSVLNTPTPAEALLAKRVRMAIVNTSAFYELGDDVFPVRREGMQAVGVIGYDTVHILTRADSDISSINDAERIGVAREGGSSEHVAGILLAGLGHEDANLVPAPAEAETPIDAQISALRDGELDAVLFMAEVGHPRILRAMQAGNLRLIGLPEWQDGNNLIRFPFLRLTRINNDAYPNMTGPVDSIGAQVVLAGPVPSADPIGTAGPGTAAVGEVLPLTSKTVTALNEALPSEETVDPAVPASTVLAPKPKPEPEPINPSTASSLVNFLAICLAVFFLYLYVRKEPVRARRKQARKSSDA